MPTPKDWKDGKAGNTPVLATELESMEERLQRGISLKDYPGDLAGAVAAAVGDTLYIGAGTYEIDCSTAIAIAAGGLRIVGAGYPATKLVCSNVAPTKELSMFSLADKATLELVDLTIEGPASIGAAGRFDAVAAAGATASGEIRARRCKFKNFTTAQRVSSTVNWTGVIEAIGCIFEGYGGEGLKKSTPILLNHIEAGARGRYLRVVDCDFYGFGDSATNLDHGIYISSDWDFDIRGNRFHTSVGGGYCLQVYDTTVTAANRGMFQKFRGNWIGSALTTRGVVAAGVSNIDIRSNTFEHKKASVKCEGGSAVIAGNDFVGTIESGNHIEGASSPAASLPVVVTDNDFRAKSTKIVSIAASGEYIIEGNRFNPANGSSFLISVEGGTPVVRVGENDFKGKGESGIMRINVAGTLHVCGNRFLTSGGYCVGLLAEGATVIVADNDFSQSSGTSVNLTKTPATYRCTGNYGSNVGLESVASAETVTLPEVGDNFSISGEVEIKSLKASWKGREVSLFFAAAVKVVEPEGGNMRLNGTLEAKANTVLHLLCDGTNWIEQGRSVN